MCSDYNWLTRGRWDLGTKKQVPGAKPVVHPKVSLVHSVGVRMPEKWHPVGDLNPCRQDENLVS